MSIGDAYANMVDLFDGYHDCASACVMMKNRYSCSGAKLEQSPAQEFRLGGAVVEVS